MQKAMPHPDSDPAGGKHRGEGLERGPARSGESVEARARARAGTRPGDSPAPARPGSDARGGAEGRARRAGRAEARRRKKINIFLLERMRKRAERRALARPGETEEAPAPKLWVTAKDGTPRRFLNAEIPIDCRSGAPCRPIASSVCDQPTGCGHGYSHLLRTGKLVCDECRTEEQAALAQELQQAGIELGWGAVPFPARVRRLSWEDRFTLTPVRKVPH